MSSALVSQIGSGNVAATLSGIESRTRRSSRPDHDGSEHGPFGVIDFQENPAPSGAEIGAAVQDIAQDNAVPSDASAAPSLMGDLPLPPLEMDFALQWDDLFAFDFENEYSTGQNDLFLMDVTPELTFDAMSGVPSEGQPGNAVAPEYAASACTPTVVFQHAQIMLKYFLHHVIPSMAGLPFGRKSPWKVGHLVSAVHTLAELTYLDIKDVKHANAANLFGLLASSSYMMSGLGHAGADWKSIFDYTRHEAKRRLQLSLREEMNGPKKAKYKEQLQAMLSLFATAVICGSQDDARRLIIDTERLLRTRGLSKPFISSKCRMLHHVYTWARIVCESTYVLHDYGNSDSLERRLHGEGARSAAERGPHTQEEKEAPLDNFLRLDFRNEEDITAGPKDPGVGLHDIHLDDPRKDFATMYDQIYGLPEPWLSLLSRTIKLANVIDAWRSFDPASGDLTQPEVLQKRARAIEDMVCSYAAQDTAEDSFSPNYHMTRALTAALVIYFYRRVRDVNPWMMQKHVDDVISALRDYDHALQVKEIQGPGTAWPAYIAGCEALTTNRREPLAEWVARAHRQTGMMGYKNASDQMREVWRRRDEADSGRSASLTDKSTSWTWMAVSRDRGEWILLC